MQEINIYTYASALKAALPAEAFRPHPWRLAWIPLHLALIAAAIVVIAHGWGGIAVAGVLSLVIGQSFAGLAFVGHETLHGSVVTGRRRRHLVGWLTLLPFFISPRLWTVWHNQVHHGHTKHPELDPDCYPSLATYQRSRVARVVDRYSLGHGHPAGFLSLILGMTGQSLQCLFKVGGDRRYMTRREHGRALAETGLDLALWAALAVALGPVGFLFAYLIPLLVANTVVMAYIHTNHGLSPLTEVNDPLLNSLSVTTPRLLRVLHLNFGYHVEHHIFPKMSPANAPRVSQMIQERWPERYQIMPLWRALLLLCRTARIYRSATTLVDPRTGRSWSTLLPRDVATAARGAV
ncbi:MAG TPA: fatty acid desaturase [Polyangia bacterium]|jgi:fatty acid desaturase